MIVQCKFCRCPFEAEWWPLGDMGVRVRRSMCERCEVFWFAAMTRKWLIFLPKKYRKHQSFSCEVRR